MSKEITTEAFDEALEEVVTETYGPGAWALCVAFGGVYSEVAEAHNNDAIDRVRIHEADEEEEET